MISGTGFRAYSRQLRGPSTNARARPARVTSRLPRINPSTPVGDHADAGGNQGRDDREKAATIAKRRRRSRKAQDDRDKDDEPQLCLTDKFRYRPIRLILFLHNLRQAQQFRADSDLLLAGRFHVDLKADIPAFDLEIDNSSLRVEVVRFSHCQDRGITDQRE